MLSSLFSSNDNQFYARKNIPLENCIPEGPRHQFSKMADASFWYLLVFSPPDIGARSLKVGAMEPWSPRAPLFWAWSSGPFWNPDKGSADELFVCKYGFTEAIDNSSSAKTVLKYQVLLARFRQNSQRNKQVFNLANFRQKTLYLLGRQKLFLRSKTTENNNWAVSF